MKVIKPTAKELPGGIIIYVVDAAPTMAQLDICNGSIVVEFDEEDVRDLHYAATRLIAWFESLRNGAVFDPEEEPE